MADNLVCHAAVGKAWAKIGRWILKGRVSYFAPKGKRCSCVAERPVSYFSCFQQLLLEAYIVLYKHICKDLRTAS